MDVNGKHPGDDLESSDAAAPDDVGFDLTPRALATRPARSSNVRRNIAIGALVVLVGALGFVLYRGLGDAATFFYNVDEAVAKQSELQGQRFRMQGNVVAGTVEQTSSGVDFEITYNHVRVPVQHRGTPPELFGPEIPVVIEGTFEGDTFHSDEILIRHDNTYDEKHSDRVKDAERDASESTPR